MSHDPVAKAVYDDAVGRAGVLTGNSGANAIGYNDHVAAQNKKSSNGSMLPVGGTRQPYEMLPFFEELRERIPLWLCGVTAVLGLMVAYFLAAPALPQVPIWLTVGAGGLLGLGVFEISIRIADVATQLIWGLWRLALKLAFVGAVMYGVYALVTGNTPAIPQIQSAPQVETPALLSDDDPPPRTLDF